MREYISLTDEQKRRANAVDLEDFLLRRGERLIPSGHDKRHDPRQRVVRSRDQTRRPRHRLRADV